MHAAVATPRTLVIAFVALLALLALSAFAAQIEHGPLNLAIGLTISVAKTAVIVTVFMGLRAAPATSRLYALTGVAWLAVLLTLLMADYVSRSWAAPPV